MEVVGRMSLVLLIVGLLTAAGRGAAGAYDEDLVTNLPGLPIVNFKLYAGYVTVDESKGRALFYYFVEAAQDPQDKPLVLWLEGGPGCSSVAGGGFSSLGPFYPNGYGTGLVKNSHSWNNAANILFLESPAGVGWSYSNSSDDYDGVTDAKTADDSSIFLLNWLEKFPEYKTRDFYLAGESYAGHYVPQLAEVVIAYNKRPTRDFVFNFKGIAIGNPLINFVVDWTAMITYAWSHGLISESTYKAVVSTCNFTEIELTRNISQSCQASFLQASAESGPGIDRYNFLIDICLADVAEQKLRLNQSLTDISLGVDVCIDIEKIIYLNLPEVQKALHANTTGLPYKYQWCSFPPFLNYSSQDLYIDIIPVLERILGNGLQVLIFSGDLDPRIPFIGTRQIADRIALQLQLPTSINYTAWYDDRQVAGFTTTAGNLTFATVRGAGHIVPSTQPSRALAMFKAFVTGTSLMTQFL